MNQETLTALKESIAKWLTKYDGEYDEPCALCNLFINCARCPVAIKARDYGCHNTPWEKWYEHDEQCFDCRYEKPCAKAMPLIRDEIKFLVGLLPVGADIRGLFSREKV